MPLPLVPQDKANHAIYGAVIALAVYAVTLALLVPYAALVGLCAAVGMGLAKEALDRWQNLQASRAGQPPPHGVEFWDFAATSLGGCAVWLAASAGRIIGEL